MADTFKREEVKAVYDRDGDRWIVSLIVAYPENFCTSAEEAAAAALDLTRGGSTHWYVFDRKTGEGQFFQQSDFEGVELR